MKSIIKLSFLICTVFLYSCAGFYHAVNPKTISFPQATKEEKVPISYRFDVLRDAGNKKMSNKEVKNRMKIVAVKLTNNTDFVINVGKDLEFNSANNSLVLMSPVDIRGQIRQSSEAYAFYFIGCISLAPLDIAIFGGVGLGNMLVASQANKALLNELTQYDIRDIYIKPGETVIGLIGFHSSYSDHISVKLKYDGQDETMTTQKSRKLTTIENKQENAKSADNSVIVETKKVESPTAKNVFNVGDTVKFYDFGTNANYKGTIIEIKSKVVVVEFTSFNQKKTVEKDIIDVTKVN